MSDASAPNASPETAGCTEEQLADLVRRALVQIGDMKEIEAEMASISERLKLITPAPEEAED